MTPQFVLFAISVFTAAALQTLAGFGFAMIVMPLAVLLFGLDVAAPLVAVIALTLYVTNLARYRRALDFREVGRLGVFAIVGVPLGVWFLTAANERIVRALLAILLLAYGLYSQLRPIRMTPVSWRWAFPAGLLAGCLGGAYNIPGPPLILYGSLRQWPQDTFRAVLQALFLISAVLVVVSHGVAGHITGPVLLRYAVALPVLLLGSAGGGLLDRRDPSSSSSAAGHVADHGARHHPLDLRIRKHIMQTMVLEVTPLRFMTTRILARLAGGAYFWPTSPLRLVTNPDPPLPEADWVRVRNRLCGICGSDLHQIYLDASLDVAPTALPTHRRIFLGHEMVGEICEAGPAVAGFAIGDRVVRWGRADDCRARGRAELCPACQRGHRVLCEIASEPRAHVPLGGGFGDTFISPASTLIKVLPELSDEQAIFIEPLAVALHAAFRRLPHAGETVLVLGCGTIGFLLMQALRVFSPAANISVLAQFSWQAELAERLGIDSSLIFIGYDYAKITEITGARFYEGRGHNRMLMGGFDLVYDVVGIRPRSAMLYAGPAHMAQWCW